MRQQRTLRRTITCAGIGLHSGKKVTLSLKPAAANSGIRFRRSDLGGREVPATVNHVGGINHATGLMRDAVRIDTVEHLLAAFVSLGVDNAVVEISSHEVPIMDGSAAPFIYLIQEAGIKSLSATRRYLKVLRPISLSR
jgi:UDP-3-O-[3-hydroxymyristoyl] N-acetylglucosamine deacetylase